MQQHEKYVQMTTTPVEKLVAKLAVPTIITMLVTAFYNMADTFFVGLMDNTSATGAVGVVFSFMAIIQACGFFFGQGAGNAVSRLLGKEKTETAAHMASVGFFSALFVGTVIMALGLIFLDPLTRLLGSTETIFPYARGYLRLILIGAPYMTASFVLNNLLRFQGNALFSMVGIGSGAVLNVALDPLFIFTFKMGVSGAALATIVSQFIGFCCLLYFCTRKDCLSVRFKNFHPTWRDYRTVIKGGLPSLCRQGLASFATISLNQMAGLYGGDPAIAAMAVATKIMMMSFSALIGFGQGFQPVCGFNYGAGLLQRVKKAYWFCVRVGTVILTVFSVAGIVFAPTLVGLFSSDEAVIPIGVLSLRLQCIIFPLNALTTMTNMMTQTIGKVVPATVLAMGRQGLFFIPVVLGLPGVMLWMAQPPLLGVQLAQPIADLITFAVAVPVALHLLNSWKKQTDRKEEKT